MPDSSIVVKGLGFPEALRWRAGELWFSDMATRRVWSVGADGNARVRTFIPGQPSGLGWLPDGTLLVSSMIDQCVVAIVDGWRKPVAWIGELAVGPTNDMLVDPQGRAYVGSHGFDVMYEPLEGFASRVRGVPLVLVREDGRIEAAAQDLMCPNGMALSADGRALFVAESAANRVTAFTVADDGSLADRRVFAELEGMPDGICIDSEGLIWAALLGAEKFVRVQDGGEVVDEIATPGRRAVDCVLGGDDGKTFFGAVTYTPGIVFSSDGEVDGGIESWRVAVAGPSAA
jgi:sugar lactone lactonase YvrE